MILKEFSSFNESDLLNDTLLCESLSASVFVDGPKREISETSALPATSSSSSHEFADGPD